ncbi:MAG: hypothetical protein C0484_14200 [Rhodospirillum sp.]|nr:hypothetical protein [Rhodospirillum sp.]
MTAADRAAGEAHSIQYNTLAIPRLGPSVHRGIHEFNPGQICGKHGEQRARSSKLVDGKAKPAMMD